MFDFLFVDLSKIYSFKFLFEGKPVADFGSWLYHTVLIGLTKWFWSWYVATTGHGGFWWSTLAVVVFIVVAVLIIALWTYGIIALIAVWLIWWFIWYFGWKFVICLGMGTVWDLFLCLIGYLITYLAIGGLVGKTLSYIHHDKIWWRQIISIIGWGAVAILFFTAIPTVGTFWPIYHYLCATAFYVAFKKNPNLFATN